MNERLGPTGKFPQGKLNEDDAGGLVLSIGTEKGHVRIDFGSPVAWIALPPDIALQFAEHVAKHARSLGGRVKR